MLIEADKKLDFSDVLLKPKRSELVSRKEVDLYRTFVTKHSNVTMKHVPVIAANMSTGTFAMAKVFAEYGMLVAIHKFHSEEGWLGQDDKTLRHSIYTIGMSKDELKQFDNVRVALRNAGKFSNLMLCVDIANGYIQQFTRFVNQVRSDNPDTVIIAGNVCTPEMVQELVINGADFVKVGIGPGSGCTTRLKTAVGYPQISAGIECSDAAHGLGAGIILDGGIRSPGDAAKAFVTNADLIMVGGMFAGTDEQEGEIIRKHFLSEEVYYNNEKNILNLINQDFINIGKTPNDISIMRKIETKKFKIFYGMSSEYAQEKHMGGMKEYRTSEGSVEEVPYVGSVENIIQDLLGGLRSAGTYIGAKNIKSFGKCGTFVKVSRQHDKF